MKQYLISIINKIKTSIFWNIIFWTVAFYFMMVIIIVYLLNADLSSAPDFVYNQF